MRIFQRNNREEKTHLLPSSQSKKDKKEIRSALKTFRNFQVDGSTLNHEKKILEKVQVLNDLILLEDSELPRLVDNYYACFKNLDKVKKVELHLTLIGMRGEVPSDLYECRQKIATEANTIQSEWQKLLTGRGTI